MSSIKFTITFYSDWHCGSGLGSGANLDLLVIKDQQDLPYIPGKTIKGLVRENLYYFTDKDNINMLLGEQGKTISQVFFTNATLSKEESEQITLLQRQPLLYNAIASTAILKTGIAKENSLRKIQTVIPMTLQAEIRDVKDEISKGLLKQSLRMIKRLGQGRNRGLGRCNINIED